jgi:hypothetical protein
MKKLGGKTWMAETVFLAPSAPPDQQTGLICKADEEP